MLGCQAVLHRDNFGLGPHGEFGTHIVMAVEAAQDKAAVEVKHGWVRWLLGQIAAAGNGTHSKILDRQANRPGFAKMRAIKVIKSPLLGRGEGDGMFGIELLAFNEKGADTGIPHLGIFGGKLISHGATLAPFVDGWHGGNYLQAEMTTRSIITLPDEKILRQVSRPLKKVDAATRVLFDDLLESMYSAPGIGLAAIQVGEPVRALVLDLAKEGEAPKPLFVANPEITWVSPELSDYEEGCLSIPEFFEMVERPRDIIMRYVDRNNEPRELQASGLLATCLQHEIDHLNGVLFIDHISKLKRDRVLKKFQKAAKLGKL